MNNLSRKFEENKKWLIYALVFTFIWGFFAHGYSFVDNNFSHDSLAEFHGEVFGNNLKLGSGRVFVPIYRDLFRGDITLPWLIGVLSLLWLGLAVFIVLRIFHIENTLLIFLTAGIFTVNVSFSATAATYIHDLDCNMFSLLCAVAAVYLWRTNVWGCLVGGVLLAGSMGIYQGFLPMFVVLVMMVCILDLLNGKTFKVVFLNGLKAIGMILMGGGLYFAAMKVILRMANIGLTTGDYNSLDTILKLTPVTLVEMVIGAYQDWFQRFVNSYSSYPSIAVKGISLLLLVIFAVAAFFRIRKAKLGVPELLLCVLLIILMPVCMNLLYVLTMGHNHDLMVYAIWLTYLLVLLFTDWLSKNWKLRLGKLEAGSAVNVIALMMVCLLLYGHVQFANGMYMKKELEYDAYLSMMTRIVDDMEEHEDYVPGETPVVFVGRTSNLNNVMTGFGEYRNVIGMISSDLILQVQRVRYQSYCEYVLGIPIILAEDEAWEEMGVNPVVQELPCWPEKGCMEIVDGIFVVKLG